MLRLGDAWTDEQRARWDDFSKDFQAHFEQWTLPAALKLGRAVDLAGGTRVLEVGCGAGGASALLRSELSAEHSWTALDLSAEMVALARAALGAGGRVVQGSAEQLPFPSHGFDRLLSNLCLMLVADPVAALGEARRVLADGGRAGWTVWGRADHSPMMTLVGSAADDLGIEVPARERPNFHLGDRDTLAQAVRDAGFSDAVGTHHPMILDVADGRAFAQQMLYTGQLRQAWMRSLGREAEGALVAEVARRADDLLAAGRTLSLDVLQVVATA